MRCEVDMKRIDKNEISELPIRELLVRWPDMARAFLKLRMSCVACPVSRFETAKDAARNYGRDLDVLLERLEQCTRHRRKPAVPRTKTATARN